MFHLISLKRASIVPSIAESSGKENGLDRKKRFAALGLSGKYGDTNFTKEFLYLDQLDIMELS